MPDPDLTNPTNPPGDALVPAPTAIKQLARRVNRLAIIQRNPLLFGKAASFFTVRVANAHTRQAYLHAFVALQEFLEQQRGTSFEQATPVDIAAYREFLAASYSAASVNVKLSAITGVYKHLVEAGALPVNPVVSIKRPRHSQDGGSTPGMTAQDVGRLLGSIDTATIVGLRDRAAIGTLAGTGARVGAVAGLTLGKFRHDGTQYVFEFLEKRGRKRLVPRRHDLQGWITDYVDAAGIEGAPPTAPLFRSVGLNAHAVSDKALTPNGLFKAFKKRCRNAGLSPAYSPHSLRVMTATELLTAGIELTDVQRLLGHASPRTTQVYDRRDRKVTPNLVEKIPFNVPDQPAGGE